MRAYLGRDEEVLVETRRSKLALVPSFVLMLIFIGAGLGVYFGVMAIIDHYTAIDVANGLKPPSGASYYFFITMIIAFMVAFILWGVIKFVGTVIRLKCEYLILTNKKIYGRCGIIKKETFDIVIEKIDTVRVNNNIIGGLFGYATIEVVSPSSSRIVRGNTVNPTFNYIINTDEFRMKVLDAIDASKTNTESK